MITQHDFRRKDGRILLGIAVERAVLDVVTGEDQLRNCIALLHKPHCGLVHTAMGNFGPFGITLNLHYDESVSILVDGPSFEQSRDQSAGIYLEKQELLELLVDVLDRRTS